MSNPSKSFLHSDDQQAGQVQKVKKVRQVQVLGISHNTTVRCGRGVAAWYDVMGMSRGGVARVGSRGVLSIVCGAVAVGWWLRRWTPCWGVASCAPCCDVTVTGLVALRAGSGCVAVGWRLWGLASHVVASCWWVGGCGLMRRVGCRGDGLVVTAMAGLVHGEVAMVSGEKDSLKAELVVVLRVATAWWGVIWSLHGGVVVVENLRGSNKRQWAG
ncbi:hypothetical protein EDB89DRAFT_1906492 [Lactarius sanguifluus]|nr:hypothetical protein EDB89DRAFT_1906492 [Lactarius sanguifluus]